MAKNKKLNTSDILANVIVEGMKNLKAKDILSLDLREIELTIGFP